MPISPPRPLPPSLVPHLPRVRRRRRRRRSYLWAVVTGPIIPLRHARARRAAPSPPSTAYFGIGNRDWGTRRTWKCPDKHRTATADTDRDRDRVVVHVFAAANERERPRIASSGASQSQSQRTQVLNCTYCMWIKPWLCASEKPFLASSERTHKILFSVLTPTVPP